MPWALRMTLYLALAGAVFEFYLGLKTAIAIEAISPWPKRRIRLIVFAIIGWFEIYPLLIIGSTFLNIGGMMAALQGSSTFIDGLVVYPFWLGLILAVQLSLFFLPIDAAKLLLYPLYKKHRPRWRKTESRVVIALVIIGVIYVVARVYNDTFTVRTRETELEVAGLPDELDGFCIAQIADLQADERTGDRKLRAYIETVNNLRPDLILFCGDLVTNGADYIETGAQALGKMEAPHGIYACLGDHDFFSNNIEMVVGNLEKNGVTVLDNKATLVPVGARFLSLTGITNTYRTRASSNTLRLIEEQRPPGPVNILLTHQPSIGLVNYAKEKGYDLFVAGHTHGGQIVFPLPGFLLTGSSFETDYVTGFYEVGNMLVSIDNGLGLTLAAVRYHAPAEVTLIRLRAVKQ